MLDATCDSLNLALSEDEEDDSGSLSSHSRIFTSLRAGVTQSPWAAADASAPSTPVPQRLPCKPTMLPTLPSALPTRSVEEAPRSRRLSAALSVASGPARYGPKAAMSAAASVSSDMSRFTSPAEGQGGPGSARTRDSAGVSTYAGSCSSEPVTPSTQASSSVKPRRPVGVAAPVSHGSDWGRGADGRIAQAKERAARVKAYNAQVRQLAHVGEGAVVATPPQEEEGHAAAASSSLSRRVRGRSVGRPLPSRPTGPVVVAVAAPVAPCSVTAEELQLAASLARLDVELAKRKHVLAAAAAQAPPLPLFPPLCTASGSLPCPPCVCV